MSPASLGQCALENPVQAVQSSSGARPLSVVGWAPCGPSCLRGEVLQGPWEVGQWVARPRVQKANLNFFFFFLIFIHFLRERERQSVSRGGAEREGGTESEAGSRLRAVGTEPDTGLERTSREITT